MLIRANLPKLIGFDAITIWPFIFITPAYASNKPLIEHELVHYREQRKWLCLPWWIAYAISKEFRFNAEVRGHAAQIKHYGCTLEWAAQHIADNYKTEKTFEQAQHALIIEGLNA